MSDPFPSKPGTNPPRYPEKSDFTKYYWAAGGVAVAILLALAFGNPSHDTKTADTPPPAAETTGQAPRAQ